MMVSWVMLCLLRADSLIFFFQAEDGIRDLYVTGVQTCALPISTSLRQTSPTVPAQRMRRPRVTPTSCASTKRSEERRVGKECRSRWAVYDYKKRKAVI